MRKIRFDIFIGSHYLAESKNAEARPRNTHLILTTLHDFNTFTVLESSLDSRSLPLQRHPLKQSSNPISKTTANLYV